MFFSQKEATMHLTRPILPILASSLLLALWVGGAIAQQVYKWTDSSGQVHYGEKKPDNAAGAIPLDIAPTPPVPASKTDPAAEVARINALSQQMARERQAAEQARQEQAIRDLEQENERLKNDLLNQQLQNEQQQQNDTDNSIIIGYPPAYSYPPYPPYPPVYPPKPYPPPPCRPWPNCHKPLPPSPEPPKSPAARPRPPFNPKPVGVDTGSPGAFRGR